MSWTECHIPTTGCIAMMHDPTNKSSMSKMDCSLALWCGCEKKRRRRRKAIVSWDTRKTDDALPNVSLLWKHGHRDPVGVPVSLKILKQAGQSVITDLVCAWMRHFVQMKYGMLTHQFTNRKPLEPWARKSVSPALSPWLNLALSCNKRIQNSVSEHLDPAPVAWV